MRQKVELTTYILSIICIIFGILIVFDGINSTERIKYIEITAGIVFSVLYLFALIFTYFGTKKKNLIFLILGILTYYIFSITNIILFINIKYLNIFFIIIGFLLIIFSTINLGLLTKEK